MPKVTFKVRRKEGKPKITFISSGNVPHMTFPAEKDEFEVGVNVLNDVIRLGNMELVEEKEIKPKMPLLLKIEELEKELELGNKEEEEEEEEEERNI